MSDELLVNEMIDDVSCLYSVFQNISYRLATGARDGARVTSGVCRLSVGVTIRNC